MWEEEEDARGGEEVCGGEGVKMGKKMEEMESQSGGAREWSDGLAIPMFGGLCCQLDLRLTIPGATRPARLVDLRACSPITHSRR